MSDFKPNLTITNVMMVGVAAIGLYAVYRMVKGKAEDVTTDENLVLLGDPLQLTLNRFYRGRLRMKSGGMPPFSANASRETIANALGMLGFQNVTVFMSEKELPSNWPVSGKRNATPETRWFEAQWRLPSATVPRPTDLEMIWVSRPPENATYVVAQPRTSGWERGMQWARADMDWDKPSRLDQEALGWWGMR